MYPRRVRGANVDLAHFFAHGDASARPLVPQIVTVLDVIPLRFPDLYRADKPNWRFRFARYLEYQAIRKATGILAISEATKRDLVDLLGVDPDKVPVREAMTPDPYTVPRGTPVGQVVAEMAAHKYGTAVITEAAKPVGIFTTVDALVRQIRADVEAARHAVGPLL